MQSSFTIFGRSQRSSLGGGCAYTYILLSLAFVIVNVLTLSNLAPWIDEVMFLDTSYNAAFHGSWATTAWYRVAGQYPFSTYPPLYQMLATVWMWLFGGSWVAVRSMNLFITFVLGGACLRLMKCHGVVLTPWTAALFTMLLWGTAEMAWMYRNGRPDMLCALMFVCSIHAIDRWRLSPVPTNGAFLLITAKPCLYVILTSALVLCSGVQAAVCLCAFWLFLFMVVKGGRGEAIRLLVLLLTGIFSGTLIVALFMLAHGRLVAFASSIIQYSDTLSSLALVVLPRAGEVLGFSPTPYMQKLLELRTSSSLGERLATIVQFRSFILLSVVALMAYMSFFRNKLSRLLGDRGFLSLLFALYVPVAMNLAGRFAIYYRWMAFLPLMVAITSIAARCRLWRVVFAVVAMAMSALGIKSMLPDGHCDNNNLHTFVERQHFKSADAVVCPFSMFYELKPVCDTCYFVGVFPAEFLGRVDYVIEAVDGDEYDLSITDYVNKLRADTTVVLTTVDHCEHPAITLYKVQKRYE